MAIEATTQLVEGSGEEGSGEEIESTLPTTFPFYDELIEAQTPLFDYQVYFIYVIWHLAENIHRYQADGEMSTKQICRCSDEGSTCWLPNTS